MATSLIIPSRNRPHLLRVTLESVLAGRARPAEIVVVDQSDAADPAVTAGLGSEDCEVRWLPTSTRGTSRARNAGVAAARHPLLVFLDDDMRVAPEWFEAIGSALVQAGPRVVVTGRVLEETTMPDRFAPSIKTSADPVVYAGRTGRDPLYTNNMAVHRSALDAVALPAVGPFDERLGPGTAFPAAEDNDLGFRLLEAGYRIAYAPEVVAWHRAWRTRADLVPLSWDYGRGQGGYYAKHVTIHDRYMARRFGADLARLARDATLDLVRHPRQALGDVVFAAGLWAGAARWLWTERRAR